MLSITRLSRALSALMLVGALVASTGAGCSQRKDCPTGTATFPISGTVTKKSTPAPGCYTLHVRRDDSSVTETVRVNRYRYLHVEALGRVTYAAEPTN